MLFKHRARIASSSTVDWDFERTLNRSWELYRSIATQWIITDSCLLVPLKCLGFKTASIDVEFSGDISIGPEVLNALAQFGPAEALDLLRARLLTNFIPQSALR